MNNNNNNSTSSDKEWLYGKLKDSGVNISYDDFDKTIGNEDDRKWYYDKATKMGLKVGSYDDFVNMFAKPQKPVSVAQQVIDEYDASMRNAGAQPIHTQQTSNTQPSQQKPMFDGSQFEPAFATHDWRTDEQKRLDEISTQEKATPVVDESGQPVYPAKPQEVAYDEAVQEVRENMPQPLNVQLKSLTSDIDRYENELYKNAESRRSSYNGYAYLIPEEAKELNTLRYVKNLIEDSQRIVDEAGKSGNTNFVSGLLRGFRDNAFDADQWTFGFADMIKSSKFLNAIQKAEKGEQLTPAEEKLLDASVMNMAINAYYGDQLGRGYKAGKVTAQSLPFMLEFAVNPVSASGSSIAKNILKYGMKKFGASAVNRTVPRIAARLVGDTAAAAAMTGTTSAGRVASEAMDKIAGNYEYGRDEQGVMQAVKTGDMSVGEAVARGFGTTLLENQSEMIFNAFRGGGKAIKDAITESVPVIGKLSNSDIVKAVRNIKNNPVAQDLRKRTQIGGVMEEYAEEVYNNLANVAIGEMDAEDALSLDNNIDTFLGLVPTQLAFSAIGFGGFVRDNAKARRNVREFEQTLSTEDRELFSELRNVIQSGNTEMPKDFIKATLADTNLTDEQKKERIFAVKDMVAEKQSSDMQVELDTEESVEPAMTGEELEANKVDIYRNYVRAERKLNSTNLPAGLKEELYGGGMTMRDIIENYNLDDAQIDAVTSFMDAKKSNDAYNDYVASMALQQRQAAQEQATQDVEQIGNIDTGNIVQATWRTDGTPAHIVGGVLAYDEEGLVDKDKSSDVIYYVDENGERKMATAEEFETVVGDVPFQQYIEEAASNAEQEYYAQEQTSLMSPEIPEPENGVTFSIEGNNYVINGITPEGNVAAYKLNDMGEIDTENGGYIELAPEDYYSAQETAMWGGPVQQIDKVSEIQTENAIAPSNGESNLSETAQEQAIQPESQDQRYSLSDQQKEIEALRNAGASEESLNATITQRANDAKKAYEKAQKAMNAPFKHGVDPVTEIQNRKNALDQARADYEAWNSMMSVQEESATEAEQPQETSTVEQPVQEQQTSQPVPAVDKQQDVVQQQEETIPTDEQGNVLYHRVPVDTTIREINSSLEPDEVDAFIAENKKEADKELKAIEKRKPKVGTNISKYKSEKQAWQELMSEAQSKADYWNDVESEIQRMRTTVGQDVADEVMKFQEPVDGHELAAQMLASGKLPILIDKYMKETGYSASEAKKMFGLFRTKENGGMTIEKAGEQLMLADREAGTNFFDQSDPNAGRNAIIDVLSQVRTRGDLTNYIQQRREASARREVDAEYNAYSQWVEDNFQMSVQDYEAYMDRMERENPYEGVDDYELDAIFAEAAQEYEQLINNKQYGREQEPGVDATTKGGDNVLPEQQSDNKGAIAGRTEERTAEEAGEQAGVDDEAAQGEAETKPVTASKINKGENIFDYARRLSKEKEISDARQEVNGNPTDAQKEAGNYKKGHVSIDGLDITIENGKGSVRTGTDARGKVWSVTMKNDYGYIRGTKAVDGDHIDIFLSDNPTTGNVYVIDAIDQETGEFDESKVMYGFESEDAARKAYLSNYEEGWKVGTITEVSKDEFKKWIDSSTEKRKPFSEYKSVQESYANNKSKVSEPNLLPKKLREAYESNDKQEVANAERNLKEFIESSEDLRMLYGTYFHSKKLLSNKGVLTEAGKKMHDFIVKSCKEALINKGVPSQVFSNEKSRASFAKNTDNKLALEILAYDNSFDVLRAVINNKNTSDQILRNFVEIFKNNGLDYEAQQELEKRNALLKSVHGSVAQNEEADDVRFREDEKSLVAVHNLSEDALRNALDLGGFPMPSIAVTNKDLGHTEFGEISLLFDKDTINPTDRRNRLYAGDAWTPVFPEIGIKTSEKVADKLRSKINDLLEGKEYAYAFGLHIDDANLSDKINRSKNFKDAYKDSEALKIAFLSQKGIPFKPVMVDKKYSSRVDNETLRKIVKEVNKGTAQDLTNLSYDETMALEPVVRKVVSEYIQKDIERIMNSLPAEKQSDSRVLKFLRKDAERELSYSDINNLFYDAFRYEREGNKKEVDRAATREKLNAKFTKKIQKEYEDWLDEISEGIIEKRGIRNERDMFTPSGNRRSWEALYDEITLDNVVKSMRSQAETGGEGVFGGSIFGAAQEEIASIDELREIAKQRLADIDSEEYEKERSRITDRLSNISIQGSGTGFGSTIDMIENITESVRRSHTSSGIYKYLKKIYPKVTKDVADEIADIVKEIQSMSTRYFEAKPYRAVGFNEVKVAVVPRGTSKELISQLENYGIQVKIYKKDDEADRKRVVASEAKKADVLFRNEEEQQESAENEADNRTQEIASTVTEMSYSLNTPIRMVNSLYEVTNRSAKRAIENGRKVKAWFEPSTGEVVVYMPNAESVNDVKRSVLHEVVGHKGLRELIGEEEYDKQMENLYGLLPENERAKVENAANKKYGSNIAVAMDEYLAEQAERDDIPSWWEKVVSAVRDMLRSIGINVELTDGDVKYLLWRSRKKLSGKDVFSLADDIAMRSNTGIYPEVSYRENESFAKNEVRERRANEIADLLRKRGFWANVSKSRNRFGNSDYVSVYSEDFRPLAKIRLSDHSVTNTGRLIDEYHVRESQTAEDVVNDLFGELDATAFREDVQDKEQEIQSIIEKAKSDGTYMKAPNGNPTNLTERQWAQVRTQSFKDWFGDWENDPANASKVVDENGEPIVVYHGSSKWFTVFNKDNVFHQSKAPDNSIFATDNVEVANSYIAGNWYGESAGQKSKMASNVYLDENDPRHKRFSWGVYREGGIYPLFMNLRNPLIIDFEGKSWNDVSVNRKDINNIVSDEINLGEHDGVLAKNIVDVGLTDLSLEELPVTNDYIAFSSNQVKSATDNTGDFDPTNPDIRYRTGDGTIEDYERSLETRKFKAREAYQDSMLALKKLQEAIDKKDGVKLKASENAYMAENQMSSKSTRESEVYGEKFFKPMIDEVAKLVDKGISYDYVKKYVMAKHGLERNKVFARRDSENVANKEYRPLYQEAEREHNKGNMSDSDYQARITELDNLRAAREDDLYNENRKKDYSGISSLMETQTDYEVAAKDFVDAFEQNNNVADLWKAINAATEQTLKKSYDSGMMSKSAYDKVRNQFEYYVPLRGWNEDTAEDVYEYLNSETSPVNSVLKSAKGRTSVADDPFATIGNMAESTILQGNRNEMKQKFLNMAINHPSDVLSVGKVWYVLDNATGEWVMSMPDIQEGDTADVIADKIDKHRERMLQLRENGEAVQQKANLDIDYRIGQRQAKEHAVIVKLNGEDYVVYVNGNPRAAQAVNGMTNPDVEQNKIFEGISRFNRWMAANFTTRNPAFVLSNLSRDLIFSMSAVAVKEDSKYSSAFRRNIPSTMKAIARGLRGVQPTTEADKYFQEFLDNGGETGYTALHNVDEYKKMIDLQLKKAMNKTDYFKAVRLAADWFSNMNRWAEDVARFNAYRTSRQMGRSIVESVNDAKEITVNFNKKGSGYKTGGFFGFTSGAARNLYLFFNAAVQSLNNFAKLAQKNKKGFTALLGGFATAGFLVPVLNSILIESLGGGDGDDDYYQNLPEWTRRNNLCLYAGDGKFITIPLPIELRAFYGLGEMAYQATIGKDKYASENVAYAAINQITELLPINPLGNQGDLVTTFMPDAIKPFWQIQTNKSFTGTPIYKESSFNENMPEWTKVYKGTSPVLVNLSEWTNEIAGGDKYQKAKYLEPIMNWNPAKVESIFESYFGGMATTINQTGKTLGGLAVSAMEGNFEENVQTRNIPVINRFLNNASDERMKYSNINKMYYSYYDLFQEMDQRIRGYSKEAAKGDSEYLDKLREISQSDDFPVYQVFKSAKKHIDKLNKMEKSLPETKEEERKEIQKSIAEIKKSVVDRIIDLKNKNK